MIDEGYIKFHYNLISGDLSLEDIEEINYYRKILFDMGYIGMKNGIGFGNISKRFDDMSFIISGSKTGGKENLKPNDYVKVIDWDFKNNLVEAKGQTAPSSESLTHAIFYELDKNINVVIHIHNSSLWAKYINFLPTSSGKAKFGTVDLVNEINNLYSHSDLKEKNILITGGHQDGIFVFHSNFIDAMKQIISINNK